MNQSRTSTTFLNAPGNTHNPAPYRMLRDKAAQHRIDSESIGSDSIDSIGSYRISGH